jgi:3-isopropylmalate dehydrogenase
MGGEGIGPEIVSAATLVLEAAARVFGFDIECVPCEVGLSALRAEGTTFPRGVERLCDEASRDGRSAILFGAVSDEPIGILRQRYDLFMNLRPARCWPALVGASPLRPQRAAGIDALVVRELVSGIYYGAAKRGAGPSGRWASQELYYDESQILRIARAGFAHAERRRRKLAYVHKGNVVQGVFGLWTEIVRAVAAEHPQVALEEYLVDNMAAQLVRRPADFDVILAENMFGDILSDLLAGVVGSIGMLPSASLNASGFGLYESIGGTAPDIAGKGIANPISTVLSAGMMCELSFGMPQVARAIEEAVAQVLAEARTPDIADDALKTVGSRDMAERIAAALQRRELGRAEPSAGLARETGPLPRTKPGLGSLRQDSA